MFIILTDSSIIVTFLRVYDISQQLTIDKIRHIYSFLQSVLYIKWIVIKSNILLVSLLIFHFSSFFLVRFLNAKRMSFKYNKYIISHQYMLAPFQLYEITIYSCQKRNIVKFSSSSQRQRVSFSSFSRMTRMRF